MVAGRLGGELQAFLPAKIPDEFFRYAKAIADHKDRRVSRQSQAGTCDRRPLSKKEAQKAVAKLALDSFIES